MRTGMHHVICVGSWRFYFFGGSGAEQFVVYHCSTCTSLLISCKGIVDREARSDVPFNEFLQFQTTTGFLIGSYRRTLATKIKGPSQARFDMCDDCMAPCQYHDHPTTSIIRYPSSCTCLGTLMFPSAPQSLKSV